MTAVRRLAEQCTLSFQVMWAKWRSLGSEPGHSIPLSCLQPGFLLMLVPFDLLGRSLMSNLWSDWPALIGRKHFCPYLSLGSLFRVIFTTEKTNKRIILNLIFFYFIVHTDICSFDHFMILFSVLLRRSLLFYTDLLCHHELYRGNQKTNSAFLSVVANDQRGCN